MVILHRNQHLNCVILCSGLITDISESSIAGMVLHHIHGATRGVGAILECYIITSNMDINVCFSNWNPGDALYLYNIRQLGSVQISYTYHSPMGWGVQCSNITSLTDWVGGAGG